VRRLLTFVRVDRRLIRVSIQGEGRPLLLVMGLGGNIEMWDPLERALNAHQIQTIAYDVSGTGDSPPRLIPLRVTGLARQAAHLLDALGYPSADVLGVSFGGGVAQELALNNPRLLSCGSPQTWSTVPAWRTMESYCATRSVPGREP
jgi:pimeloyl-ACP methyl ester carboxylesterase